MTDPAHAELTIDTPTPNNETVASTVRALYLNANTDVLSLISGTMNLYLEAKGRLTGKNRLSPEDSRRILDMVMILLDVPNAAQDFTSGKPALVPKERRQ